ncbi:hypothetical protein Natoc_3198 [Natronococcus occultus SP4]|uniref:Uncharacterized protein n=1 Tax=Natronococcus occultus SP4 TaxID=694430 RepID=L0K0X1_9EURY|nr:hypothetical protein Natoc_3198 [Natronococcus occultus SP4]
MTGNLTETTETARRGSEREHGSDHNGGSMEVS